MLVFLYDTTNLIRIHNTGKKLFLLPLLLMSLLLAYYIKHRNPIPINPITAVLMAVS